MGDRPTADRELLAEFEDILRQIPPLASFKLDTPQNVALRGRIAAALREFDTSLASDLERLLLNLHVDGFGSLAYQKIVMRIYSAIRSLQYATGESMNAAIEHGAVFKYFESLRQIIETATTELLFVDAYLNSAFASDYLTQVSCGVNVRLLGSRKDPKHMNSLLPAVKMLAAQNKLAIEVRSQFPPQHDRHVLVDGARCFLSGASFKDGGKTAATVIVELVDKFSELQARFENDWAQATIELSIPAPSSSP